MQTGTLLDGGGFCPPLLCIKLRKVFKADTLSPDFGVRKSKKSYKIGLLDAKYS
jgi:hypothetical protein